MSEESVEETKIEVRSYFVRDRNALLVRGDFSPMYVDYYLHFMQHGIKIHALLDQTLKDAVAVLTLHLASRPVNEVSAWTVNFQEPLFNLFVTGDSRLENVTGRAFSKDVKPGPSNRMISQVRSPDTPVRQSIIDFEGVDFFRAVEHFYTTSEQRTARLFRYSEEEFVMITAQPKCDEAWLSELTEDAIRELDQQESLSLLESRHYRFDCGCDLERILPTLATLTDTLIDELYGNDASVMVNCPRCGARFQVGRDTLETFLANEGKRRE